MENLEMISFQIISCVGTAKSSYIEAARKAQEYEFDKAEELIKFYHLNADEIVKKFL